MSLADAKSYAVLHLTGDETSGTRFDSVGSNHTITGSAGSGTGKFGNSISFNGITDYLQIADSDDVSGAGNTDFFIRFWGKRNSGSGNFFAKWGDSGALSGPKNREYAIGYDSDGYVGASFGGASTDGTTGLSSTFQLSTGVWYLIHVWVTGGTIFIAVDAATAQSTSLSDSSGVINGPNRLTMGAYQNGGTPGELAGYADCEIDDLVFLKDYILDDTERTADFGGGSGVPFANWDAGGGGSPAPFLPAFAAGFGH